MTCQAFHPILGKEKTKDYFNFEVRHKNNLLSDNNSTNLEWKELNLRDILNRKATPIVQVSLDDKFINFYGSILEASTESGISEHTIKYIAKGHLHSSAIYNWRRIVDINREERVYTAIEKDLLIIYDF